MSGSPSSADLTDPKFDFRSSPESGFKSELRHFRFVLARDSCTQQTAAHELVILSLLAMTSTVIDDPGFRMNPSISRKGVCGT